MSMRYNQFDNIYAAGGWSGMGSGPGSVARYNKEFLRYISHLIASGSIRKIIDYGCGDWQLFRDFNFRDASYLGYDVVSSVIEENKKSFRKPKVSFERIRHVSEVKETCDLFLIKDVFLHLPNHDCLEILEHAKLRSKHILVVNDCEEDEFPINHEIDVGKYRPVDIALPPFSQSSKKVLIYGQQFRTKMDLKALLSLKMVKRVQTGRKHVQLIQGHIDYK